MPNSSLGIANSITRYGTRLEEKVSDKKILKIRATCGEVTSKQLVRIADITDKYGNGFVHFAVRGSPEIPGIDRKGLETIRKELKEVGLQILDRGIDNLQSCFGNYCTESLADPQTLLRRIEKKVEELGLNNLNITLSASGCPNSCGIAHLNDIGFHGVLEPVVDVNNCNGCGLCLAVCKRKAIEVSDVAVIDKEKCRHCGACVAICPANAIVEKRRGFAALVGFRGGENTQLGQVIAEFLSEEEAFQLAENYLILVKARNVSAAAIIDEIGIERFKTLITAAKQPA